MTEATAPYKPSGFDEQARLGNVTASRISDIVAKRKDGYPAASRTNYLAELVLERLTGIPQDQGYQSEAMLRGIQLEAEALDNYSWATEMIVLTGEYTPHPRIERAGATPDGVVMAGEGLKYGLVEVKCPNSATHLATLEGASIKKEYIDQIQWQMACTGAQWTDFVSYDPRFPGNMSMYRERIERDDAYIEQLEKEVTLLLTEVDKKTKWLLEMFNNG